MKKLIQDYLKNATAYKAKEIPNDLDDIKIKFHESHFCLVSFQRNELEWVEEKINIWDVLVYVNSKIKEKQTKPFPCDHQTISWGQHKRKCTKCGKIFVVD